jgi:hypothetical protein
MSEINYSYYQFQKSKGYQIYLRFEDFDFETQLSDIVKVIGFDKVERKTIKDLSFSQHKIKILKIAKASSVVSRKISETNFQTDRFGGESVSRLGGYNLYRLKHTGMMVFSRNNPLWELGIKDVSHHNEIRVMLTRFLSFAFEDQGVVGFWGVPVEQGFVVMNREHADFESIFIDLNKNIILTYDGVKSISSDLQILRLDDTVLNDIKPITKEALISFLSMNTCHLSYEGLSAVMKAQLFQICKIGSGFIYPADNFSPRSNITELNEAA